MSDGNEQPMPKPASAKEKVSFQLPVEVVKKLEEIIFYAKQEMSRNQAKQLTKSKLVELAVRSMIWEYDKGDTKGLMRSIILCWTDN